ncbi:MAG: hypothetical protein IJQ76_07155 [Prevotella sp.]|nr:hypothetical protein [Prevotella sp.]
MNKKAYQQPQLHIVNVQVDCMLGDVNSMENNVDIRFGGFSTGAARSRDYEIDWEE